MTRSQPSIAPGDSDVGFTPITAQGSPRKERSHPGAQRRYRKGAIGILSDGAWSNVELHICAKACELRRFSTLKHQDWISESSFFCFQLLTTAETPRLYFFHAETPRLATAETPRLATAETPRLATAETPRLTSS